MIELTIIVDETGPDGTPSPVTGTFRIDGQNIDHVSGSTRYLQTRMLVHSDRYGRLISFEDDGEEWARNLHTAYGNGHIGVLAKEIVAVEREPRVALGEALSSAFSAAREAVRAFRLPAGRRRRHAAQR